MTSNELHNSPLHTTNCVTYAIMRGGQGAWYNAHLALTLSHNNNNNIQSNNLICTAPACRMTSEALADSSSRAKCLMEK